MKKNSIFNVRRLLTAIYYSFRGLKAVLRSEAAFRQELILSIILIPAAFYFGATVIARALLISSWLLVLIVELINSAIETIVNRIGTDYHELSGKAKDIGSAAVLVALLNAAVIWALLIWPHFC